VGTTRTGPATAEHRQTPEMLIARAWWVNGWNLGDRITMRLMRMRLFDQFSELFSAG
jgi:hypothetical protein